MVVDILIRNETFYWIIPTFLFCSWEIYQCTPKPQYSTCDRTIEVCGGFWSYRRGVFQANYPQLCSTVLDVISSIYHQDSSNYFIVEPQNTLSQFAEKIHTKTVAVRVRGCSSSSSGLPWSNGHVFLFNALRFCVMYSVILYSFMSFPLLFPCTCLTSSWWYPPLPSLTCGHRSHYSFILPSAHLNIPISVVCSFCVSFFLTA